MSEEKTVAIVGRPNVGKSALFNRISKRQISLVFDRPGTTRDRLTVSVRWSGGLFQLIDTGGIGLEDAQGFEEAIAHEVNLAIAAASEILFVVDARQGLTPLDREVAQRLRKTKRRIIVVANKCDSDKQENLDAEFSALGFGSPFPVSAAHGRGIDELLETLTEKWPHDEAPVAVETEEGEEGEAKAEEPKKALRPLRLAIVGRPNVGKSSLVNTILSDKRTIVSDVAGTTRDALDIPYSRNGRNYMLIDTAGLRQERRVSDPLEQAMTGRSVHSIHRADAAVLVIDATMGVTAQDKKIAGLLQDDEVPCLVAINKWDIAREQGDASKSREREYYEQVMNDLFFLHYAPVLFLSAKTGERVDGLFKLLEKVEKARLFRFLTGPLNRVIAKAMVKQPPPIVRGRRFKIIYATQEPNTESGESGSRAATKKRREIPGLVLFCNDSRLLTDSYRRYLEMQLRESFDLPGCPLRFVLRSRQSLAEEGTK